MSTLLQDEISTDSRTGPRERAWILGLFVGALLLRVAHLWTVRESPLFLYLFIDPKMYDEWGASISGGHLLGPAPFFLDPLYPYFIGGIYGIFGRSYLAVAAVQGLLGAMVAPLVHDAARRWFARPVPQIAGVLAAVYPLSIYYGSILLKPGLAVFLVASMLWLLSRALRSEQLSLRVAAGCLLGLTVLVRGNLLLVVPVLALAVLLSGRTASDRPGRFDWRGAGGLLAGVAVTLVFPLGHNLIVSGEPILTTTNWGQILYIGNNPDNPSGRFEELPFVRSNPIYEQVDFKREAERRAGRQLTHGAVSRYWFTESLAWIGSSPGDWLAVSWSKLRLFWGGYETPASQDFYLYRRYAPLLRAPVPGFGLLGALGLLGTVLAFGRPGWPRLLSVWVVACSAAVVAFFVLTRFRMVVIPALFVLAAFAAVETGRSWSAAFRGKGRFRAAALTGLLLVCFAFVNLPVRATADCWSYRVASAIGLPIRLENTANAHFNLAVTLAARAEESGDPTKMLRRAERHLAAANEEEPRYKSMIELGKVQVRLDREEEAVRAFERALELQPYAHRGWHLLGRLHRRLDDPDAAEQAFRRALQLVPRYTPSALRLGEVLLEAGKREEAERWFRHVLRLDPGNREARAGLDAVESR